MTEDNSTSIHLEKKQLLALLRGIVQHVFYNTLSREQIKDEVFAADSNTVSPQAQDDLIDMYSALLKHAAAKNFSPSQFTDYLNHSTENKYHKHLSENDILVLSHFWNGEYHKIHSVMIAQSNFTSSLSEKKGGLKWRIDQLTNPDDLSDMTETVAIVELNTTKEKKVVFEVDKVTLFSVVDQLQDIQNRINSLSM